MVPIYEDISDDEFDPTEIIIVKRPFNYMGTIYMVSGIEISEQNENTSNNCMNKSMDQTRENHLENIIETDRSEHVNDVEDDKDIVTVKQEPDDQTYQEDSINDYNIKVEPEDTEAAIEKADTVERSKHFIKVRRKLVAAAEPIKVTFFGKMSKCSTIYNIPVKRKRRNNKW